MNRRMIPIGSLVLFGLFLLVMLATWLLIKPPTAPAELVGVLRPQYQLIQPFELTDHHQRRFDESNFQGKWSLIFFGYLSCPDVCPLTLNELSVFWRLLQDDPDMQTDNLQILFVSVDPARDSSQALASYIKHFNPEFTAATAPKAQIDSLAKQFGAGYVIEAETAPGQYLVAHSSAIFLVDPLGRSVATFSQPHYGATLAEQYRRITRYFSAAGLADARSKSIGPKSIGSKLGVVTPVRLFPLLACPDKIGGDQYQIDDEADGKETNGRYMPCGRRASLTRFSVAQLLLAHEN
jgi:protein SCO1